MQKILIIVVGFFLITFVGTCIYFVAGVSDTFPPIKEYSYEQDFSVLVSDLNALLSANKKLSYRIADRTGDRDIGYRYYITINLEQDSTKFEYQFFWNKIKPSFEKEKAGLALIYAYNITLDKGGYGYGNGTNNMGKLVDIFEKAVLNHLKHIPTSPIPHY